MVAILITVLAQTAYAQQNDNSAKTHTLLPAYYSIKDALVKGDATMASTKAKQLTQYLNLPTSKEVTGNSHDALLKSATEISSEKDLEKQRQSFSTLSATMIVLAKSTKLAATPVYQQYCPMKKSAWLSAEKTVKNPYYGSSMLTCGSVVNTFN